MSSKKSKKTQKLGSSRRYRNHNRDIGEKDNNDDLQDPGNEDHDSEQSQFLTVSENQSCNETSPPRSDQAVTDCPTPSTLGSEDFSHIQSQDFKDLLAQDEVQSKKRKMGSTRKINRNLKSERFHEDDSKPRILLSEGASNEQGVSTEEITIEDRGREDQTCEMDFAPYQASEHQDNQKGDEKQHGERPLQNKPTGISFSELNQAEDTAHSSHDFGVVMPTESNVPLEELDEPLQIGHRMDTLSEPVVSLSHTKDQKSKTGTIYTPLIENRDEQDVQRSPNTRIQIKSSKSEETVLETTTVQSISSLLIRDKQERKDGDIQETFLAEDKGQDEDSDLQLSSLINKQEHGTQDEKVTTVILQNVGTKASTVDEDIVGYSLELKDDTLKLNKKSDYGSENTGFRENIDENKEVCGGGCRTDNDLNERVAPTNITQATQPDINIISPLRLEDPRVQTSADQFPSNEFKFQGDKELKDHGEERVDVTDARCWKGESSADKDIEKKEVDICYDEEENRELRTETEVENNDVQATTTNQLIISKVSSTNMFCTLNESELIPAETLYEEADTSTQTCNLQHSNPGEFPIESEMQAREGISSDQMYDNVTNERSGFLDIRSGLSEEVKNDIKEESNAGSTECFTKDDFKTLNVQKDDLFPFKNEHEMPSISTNIQDSDFTDQVSMAIEQRGSESSEKGNASLVHAHHTSKSLKLLPGSQFKSDIQVYNNIKAPVQMKNMSQECLVNSTNMESEAKQFGSTCPGVCKHESRLGQNDAVAENMSHAETQSSLSGLISEGNKTDNFKAMKKTPQTESTEEITPTSVDGTLSTTLQICPQSSESLNAMELQADKLDGSVIKAVVKNDNTKTARECFKAAQHILADPVSINQEYNLVDRQDEETVMVKGICGGVDTTYAVLPDIAEHLVHTEVLKMQSRTEDGQPISLDDPHQNTYPDLKLEQYRSPICTEVTMIEPMDAAEATHQPKGNILHATTTPVLEESHMLMNTNKSSEKMGSRHGSLELKREDKEAMYGDVKDILGTDRARLKETEGVVREETNNDKREAINVGPTKGFIMEDLEKCSQQYMYSELTSEKYSDALTTIEFHAKVHCDLKEDSESNIENMVKAKAELRTQSQTKKKKKFGSTRRPQGRHQLHAEGEEREGKDSESTEEIIQAAASNLLTESHNTKSKVVADVHDFPVTTDENQITNSEVEISNREIYAPPATLSNEVEQIDTGVFDEVSHAEEPAGTIEKNEKPSLNEEKDAESTLPCEQEMAPIITKIQDDGFSENASQAKGKESPVPQHASEVNADSTSESTTTPDSEQNNKSEAIKEKENLQEQNMDQNLMNIGAIKEKKPDADPTEKIIKEDITAIFSDQYIPSELSSQTTDLALTTVEHPSLGTEQSDFKEDDGDRKENVENKNAELQTQIQSKKKKKFGSTRRPHGRHQLHSEGEDGERKDPENTEEISQTATSNLLKEPQNTMNEAALDVDDLPMTTKQKQIINSEVEIMTREINAPPATLSNKVDEINMQVSDEVSNVERITAIKDKNENATELPDFKEDDGDSIENVENKNTEPQTQIPSKKKKFGSTRRPQRRHQLHADGEEGEEKDPESTEEIIPAAASNLLSKPQNTKSKVVPDVHDFPVTTDENQITNSEVEISNSEIYAPPATLSNEVEQIDTGVFDEVSHAEEPAGTIEKSEKPSLNEENDAESTLPCEQEMAPIITKIQDDGFSENASQAIKAKGKESPVPQHACEVNADSTSGSVELNPEAQAMSIMQMDTENTQVDASNQIQNITEAKTESEPEQPQSTTTPDSKQDNKSEAIKKKENLQEQNLDQNLINIGAIKEKKPDADPTEKIIKEDITAIFSDQYIPSELSSQTTDLALTTVEHPSLGTEQSDFKEDDGDRKENVENKNTELQTQIQSKKKKFGSTRRSHERHQLHSEGEDGERRDPENTEEISQTATSNLLKEPQNTMSEAALDVDDLPMTTKQKQIINSEVEIMTGEINAPPATLSNEVEQIDTGVFDEVSHAEEPAGTIEKSEKPSLNEEKDAESTLPCEQEMAPIITKIQDDGFSENASQAKGKESPVPKHASEVNADSTSGSVERNPEAQAMSIMQMDTENTQVDASNQIQNITEAKTESEPEQPQSTITPDSEQKNKPEAIKEKENLQEQNMDQNLINIGAIKEKKPDADPTEKLSKEDITAIFSDQYIPSELSSQTTDLALTTVEHPSLGTEQPDFKEDDGDRKENVENKNTELQTQIQSKKKKKFGSTRRSHGRHQLHAEGEDGERKDPENTEEISQTATSNLLKEPQNTMNEAALDVDDLPMTTKQKQIINSEVEIMTGEINAPPATLSNKVDEINMQVSDEVSNVERITAIKDKNENPTELPDFKEDDGDSIENVENKNTEFQTQIPSKKKKFGSTRRPQRRHQLHADGEEGEEKDPESTEEIIPAAASNLLSKPQNTKSKVVPDVHDFPVTTDENQIANSEVEISNREIYAPPATLSNEVEQIDTRVFDEVSHAEEPAGTIEKNEKPSLNEEKDAESTLPCEQEMAPIITKIQDDGFSENASQAKGKESPVPQHASEVNADSTSGSVELNPEAQAMSIMQMDTENTQVDASNQIQNITEAKTESEPEQPQSTITPDSEQKNKPEAIKEKENLQAQNMDQNLINIGAIKEKKPDADPTEKIIKEDITAIFSDQYIPSELSSQTTDLALTTVEHPSLGTEQPDFKEDDGDRKENVENKNAELQTQIQSKKKKKFGSTRRSHGRHQLHSEGEDGERRDPENTEEISQTATSNLLKEPQNTMSETALDVDDLPMTTKQKQIINSEVEIMTGEINAPPATLSNEVDEINMQVSDEVSNVERITAIKDKNENPTELPDFKEDDGDSIENVENKNTELQTQIPSKKKKFGSTRRPQRRHQLHADGEEEEEKDPESTEEIIPAAASNLLSKPQNTKSKVVPDVHDFPVTTDENQIANSEVEISNREIYAPPATLSNEVEQIDTGVFDEVSHAAEPAGTIEKNEKPSLNEEKDAESTLPCEQEMAPIITKIQDDGFSENASQAKGKESPVPQHASEVNADSTSGSVELNPEAQAMSIMQMDTENIQVDASNQIQNITEAKTESEPEQPQSTITPDSEQDNKSEAIKEKENLQKQNMDQNLMNIGAIKEKKPDADPTEKIIKEDITAIFSDQYIPSELSSQTTDLALTTVEHPSLGTEQPDFKEDYGDRKENVENKNAELQTQIQSKKKKKFGSTRRSHGRHQLHSEGEDGERRDPENTEEISQTATSNLLKEPQNTMSEAALDVDDLPMTTKQKQIINSEVEIMTGEINAPPATLSNEVDEINMQVSDEVSNVERITAIKDKNENPTELPDFKEDDGDSIENVENKNTELQTQIPSKKKKFGSTRRPQRRHQLHADGEAREEKDPESTEEIIAAAASNLLSKPQNTKSKVVADVHDFPVTTDENQITNSEVEISNREIYAPPATLSNEVEQIDTGVFDEVSHAEEPAGTIEKNEKPSLNEENDAESTLPCEQEMAPIITKIQEELPDFKEDDGASIENVENKNAELHSQTQMKKKKFGSTRRTRGRYQLHAEGEEGEEKDSENSEEITEAATSDLFSETQNTMNIMIGEIDTPSPTLSNKVDPINMEVSDGISNSALTVVKNENITVHPDFGTSLGNVENKNTERHTQTQMKKKKKLGSTRRSHGRHQVHAEGEDGEEKDVKDTVEMQTVDQAVSFNLPAKLQNVSEFSVDTLEPMLRIEQGADGTENKNTNQQTYITHGPMEVICVTEERIEDFEAQIQNELYQPEGSLLSEIEVCLNKSFECSLNTTAEQLPEDSLHLSSSKNPDIHMEPNSPARRRKMGSSRKISKNKSAEDISTDSKESRKKNENLDEDNAKHSESKREAKPVEETVISEGTEDRKESGELTSEVKAVSQINESSTQATGQPVPEGRRKFGSRRTAKASGGIGAFTHDDFESNQNQKDVRGTKDELRVSDQDLVSEPESTPISYPDSVPRTRIEDVRKTSMEDTNTSTEAGLVSFTNTIKTSPRRIPELDLKQIPDFEKAVYNVVMVGNSNVGKTSFIKRLQSGCFNPEYNSTIGVDTFVQTITFDSKTVKLYLWDTAGQERYHSITKQVFHKAQGLLLMYDITSSQSFLAVRAWISQVQEKASPDVIMMLLGNKNDCADREVQIQKGEDLSKEYNIPFMECSAATGENVLESLKTLAWLLLKQRVRKEDEYTTLQPKPQNRKSGCC